MENTNIIKSGSSDVRSYLERYDSQTHRLAQMISKPDATSGLEHTPSEIAQQPLLWRKTTYLIRNLLPELRKFLKASGVCSGNSRSHIILTGAGTSDYVGLSLADLFRINFRTSCSNFATTRITASPEDYLSLDHQYLIVHFARSGNSPESRAVLELALRKYPDNTRHIVITCNSDGVLAKTARANPDKVFLILLPEESNDKGLAMTSSFSSMITAGQALVNLDNFDEFEVLIDKVASSAEFFIETYADEIYNMANPTLTRAFYLGNKDLLGAANESALKVQELTVGHLIAKAEDTLTFRHGPISAVDPNTLVCFFLSEDPFTFRYELDVVKQYYRAFEEMGAKLVLVGSGNHSKIGYPPVCNLNYDPEHRWNIPFHYQVNISVIFGQLFGLFAATRRGINVDNPSIQNALYSRTVQGVRLYERK
ncbi:MAG: SIS domain-containing protein [Balneolales bacterium]|nr:SIS domain-containing protein [Balneolales bacterium]